MIPVHNIYYMLSYAFQILKETGYKQLETEEFENVPSLCAEILITGISLQLKKGLRKEYIEKTENIPLIRGRIEVSETIKTLSFLRKRTICTFEDFSVNSYMNRILKTTMLILIKSNISKVQKKNLRKLLVYFDEVEILDIHNINWNLQYNRNNQTYRMLVSICNLVIHGLIQTNTSGHTVLMDFVDEQKMHRLYEKFILEYYRQEYQKFSEFSANSSQIDWALDDEERGMLPIMQSDIMLKYRDKTLIIDAKYYGHVLQNQYHSSTIHSNNLYQIFTYVKNYEEGLRSQYHEKVSGMLLYAKTDEGIDLDKKYKMSGNEIRVKTLDLDCKFNEIKNQLDSIVEEQFNITR